MKRLFLVFLISIFVFSLASCTNEEQPKETTPEITQAKFEGSLEGYTIIVPEGASSELMDYVNSFSASLSSSLGCPFFMIDTDTEIPEIDKVRTDKEILVGMTNRDETKDLELSPRDFFISAETSRIVICGGDDVSTKSAMNHFLAEYVNDSTDSVVISSGESYTYVHEYPTVMINGNDIKEYTISVKDEYIDEAVTLRDRIADMTGATLPISTNASASGKLIKIDVDFPTYQSVYSILIKNDNLIIGAPTQFGLQKGLEAFFADAKIGKEAMETINLDKSYNLTSTYVTNINDTTYKKAYLHGTTSKDALTYEVGEEIEFRVKVLADESVVGCDKFTYTIYRDGKGSSTSASASALAGELIVKTSLDIPGTVQLTVSATNKGKPIGDPITIGAVVGFEDVMPYAKAPADFEEFWRARMSELYKIDPKDTTPPTQEQINAGVDKTNYFHLKKLTAADIEYYNKETGRGTKASVLDSADIYEFYLKAPGSMPATGYISVPKNAKDKSLPIKISTCGAGVYRAYMAGGTSSIYVSMNTHGLPNDLPQTEYEKLKSGKLANYGRSAEELKNPETTYFVYVLLRNMQAIRYAMTLPQWNGTEITATGSSQGGFQSIAIAALGSIAPDMPITQISAVHPWACDLGAPENLRQSSSFGNSTTKPGAAYFDTANFAALVKSDIKAHLECGFADTVCPVTGITAAYNALQCEKEITYHQARTHTQDLGKLNYIVEWTRKN